MEKQPTFLSEFIGPDHDHLVIARLLVPQQWIIPVARLDTTGYRLIAMEDEDSGSYVCSYSDPMDAAMAAMLMSRYWYGDTPTEECFFCGASIVELPDIESSLGSDQNQCSKCRAEYDDSED